MSARPDPDAQIGQLSRVLHELLAAMGHMPSLQAAAGDQLPDMRKRLDYISELTGSAAERALDAIDRARTHQDGITAHVAGLRRLCDTAHENDGSGRLTPEQVMLLSGFLDGIEERNRHVAQILMDIMMAQDFHDLTTQVLGRVMKLCVELEGVLRQLVVDAPEVAAAVGAIPAERAPAERSAALDGPQVPGAQNKDAVTNQQQVDDLLQSLGF